MIKVRSIKPPRTRRYSSGLGRDGIMSIYIARLACSKQLVGVYTARDLHDLIFAIDECVDPYECEYAIFQSFGMFWPGVTYQIPPSENDTQEQFDHAWSLSSDTYRQVAKARWFPLSNSYVYFVKSGDAIKIGTTKQLGMRLNALRASLPNDVEILRIMPGSSVEERKFHVRFIEHRISGEWFRDEGSLREFLDEKPSSH